MKLRKGCVLDWGGCHFKEGDHRRLSEKVTSDDLKEVMEPVLQTLRAEGTACANALRQEESVQQQQQQPGEGERLESKARA